MDFNKPEDAEQDKIADLVAFRLLGIGKRFNVGVLLRSMESWKVSHKVELEYTSDTTLERLKEEFDDPDILKAFVDAVNEILGWRLEAVAASLIPKPLHPSIINQVEAIMLKVEEKVNTWTTLEFGKYAGKTLPQIMFNDPDWFFWAYVNAVFQGLGNLASEADEIHGKSRSIRVPQHVIQEVMAYWHDYGFPDDGRSHKWIQRRHRNCYRVLMTAGDTFEIYRDRGVSLKSPKYIRWYATRQL